MASGGQTDDVMWERKYFVLQKHCQEIEQENERIVNRIYHVRKLLKRYRRQRRFVIEKLEEHGDDYQSVTDPFQSQLQEEIRSEGLPLFERPHVSYEYDNSAPLVRAPSTVTASFKKSRGRGTTKQDKEKDPNAPKKPANAFFMYCQQQRTVMHEDQKDPTMGHHELTKCLAKEWNNLHVDEKKVYYEMYEKDKERYEQEMKRYSSDKIPKKQPSAKKRRPKALKEKPTPTPYSATASPAISESSSDVHSSLVVSPTLNPLSPHSLASMPFHMPHIVSPQQEFEHLSTEGTAFEEFDQLTPGSHESFGL